jgi:hypothetical protein
MSLAEFALKLCHADWFDFCAPNGDRLKCRQASAS